MQTSVSLKDGQRSHCLGMCVSLNSTMIQCNIAHVSLNYHLEAKDNVPQILKEIAAATGG